MKDIINMTIRMPADLYRIVQAEAEREERSISEHVRWIIKMYLKNSKGTY